MLTIIAGVIMLGVLVFVHELGHFCVAKWCGVKVLKFSLGFGPRLLTRQRGETEYMICAIPLGGYVQMLGEGGGDDGEKVELTAEERERSFADKPVSRRIAIVAAGPLMNLIFPLLVLPLAYLVGINLPAYLDAPPCIGHVIVESEGADAGFVAGDCLIAVNGDPVTSWSEANEVLIPHAGSPLALRVIRQGEELTLSMNPENGGMEGLQSIGLLPEQLPVVGAISPNMPAADAGMQVGDRILSIDGEPILSWYDLRGIIRPKGASERNFVVERGGETLSLQLTPVPDTGGDGFIVGISPQPEVSFKRFGLVRAIEAGAERTADLVRLTLVFVQKMFAGEVSTKSIGGPITVMQIAGQAAQTDLASILTVLAFLSIQLGILNLLPIPVLDGGHLFFYLFEIVFRRPLSLRAREIAQQVGLILLLMLMVMAFYNDIVRIFFGGA